MVVCPLDCELQAQFTDEISVFMQNLIGRPRGDPDIPDLVGEVVVVVDAVDPAPDGGVVPEDAPVVPEDPLDEVGDGAAVDTEVELLADGGEGGGVGGGGAGAGHVVLLKRQKVGGCRIYWIKTRRFCGVGKQSFSLFIPDKEVLRSRKEYLRMGRFWGNREVGKKCAVP